MRVVTPYWYLLIYPLSMLVYNPLMFHDLFFMFEYFVPFTADRIMTIRCKQILDCHHEFDSSVFNNHDITNHFLVQEILSWRLAQVTKTSQPQPGGCLHRVYVVLLQTNGRHQQQGERFLLTRHWFTRGYPFRRTESSFVLFTAV